MVLKKVLDERAEMHRLKSTRFAVMIAVAAMAFYILYSVVVNHIIPRDVLAFMLVIALAKIGALAYYRVTN